MPLTREEVTDLNNKELAAVAGSLLNLMSRQGVTSTFVTAAEVHRLASPSEIWPLSITEMEVETLPRLARHRGLGIVQLERAGAGWRVSDARPVSAPIAPERSRPVAAPAPGQAQPVAPPLRPHAPAAVATLAPAGAVSPGASPASADVRAIGWPERQRIRDQIEAGLQVLAPDRRRSHQIIDRVVSHVLAPPSVPTITL